MIGSKDGRPQIDVKKLYSPEFLSDLIHIVNHDIGNPLTAIITLASLIERTAGPNPLPIPLAQLASYGGSVTREAWKISTISEHLVLLLSQRSVTTGEVRPSELIDRAVSRLEMRGQLQSSSILIDDLHPSPTSAGVDAEQIQVVVSELLLNAKRELDELERTKIASGERIIVSGKENESSYDLTLTNRVARSFDGELSELFNPLIGMYRDEKCLGLGLTAAALTAGRFGLILTIRTENRGGVEYFVANLSFPLSKS